jgi:hypothetical protein
MANFSKSVLSYRDIHLVFEKAGELGSVVLEFETPQRAVTWASRANAYRVLLRKQNQALGRDHTCEFDHLMVRRPQGSNTIRVEPRGFDFVAKTEDGEIIDLSKQTLDGHVASPHEQSIVSADIDSFLDGFGQADK